MTPRARRQPRAVLAPTRTVAQRADPAHSARPALPSGTAGVPLGASLYDRAQKRGANYQDANGIYMLDADGVAHTNLAVLAQLDTLQTAVLGNNAVAAAAARRAIENEIFRIYSQSTLRYAYLLDTDNAGARPYAEHQGEGWAFWRVIEPDVASVDSAGAAAVTAVFQITGSRPSGVRHYCNVRTVLNAHRLARQITADFGTLENVPANHCAPPPSGVGDVDDSGGGADDEDGSDTNSSGNATDTKGDAPRGGGGELTLAGGVIAGIVIAILVMAVCAGALLFYYSRLSAKRAAAPGASLQQVAVTMASPTNTWYNVSASALANAPTSSILRGGGYTEHRGRTPSEASFAPNAPPLAAADDDDLDPERFSIDVDGAHDPAPLGVDVDGAHDPAPFGIDVDGAQEAQVSSPPTDMPPPHPPPPLAPAGRQPSTIYAV
jgi:hypothetical protein